MSRAVRTGIREDRKTSKLRTSPSISSSGSTSLVVGMFLDTLRNKTPAAVGPVLVQVSHSNTDPSDRDL